MGSIATARVSPRLSGILQAGGHSAHVGRDVVIYYRWHPLYGRHARCSWIERRASGEIAHIELAPGVVTRVAAWKLDPVFCAAIKVGTPRVSIAALGTIHELLVSCESRLVSSDGNTVTQEAVDGIGRTTCRKDGACSNRRRQAHWCHRVSSTSRSITLGCGE
jgi:hypothetical protein